LLGDGEGGVGEQLAVASKQDVKERCLRPIGNDFEPVDRSERGGERAGVLEMAGIRLRRSSSASSAETTNGCKVTKLPPWRRCQTRASAISSASPASAAPASAPRPL
jgi:hypothetical protein